MPIVTLSGCTWKYVKSTGSAFFIVTSICNDSTFYIPVGLITFSFPNYFIIIIIMEMRTKSWNRIRIRFSGKVLF